MILSALFSWLSQCKTIFHHLNTLDGWLAWQSLELCLYIFFSSSELQPIHFSEVNRWTEVFRYQMTHFCLLWNEKSVWLARSFFKNRTLLELKFYVYCGWFLRTWSTLVFGRCSLLEAWRDINFLWKKITDILWV